MNGKELLNFANKLEDENKDKGYKWLYDVLRYEIIKKHQEAINYTHCCESDSEQLCVNCQCKPTQKLGFCNECFDNIYSRA